MVPTAIVSPPAVTLTQAMPCQGRATPRASHAGTRLAAAGPISINGGAPQHTGRAPGSASDNTTAHAGTRPDNGALRPQAGCVDIAGFLSVFVPATSFNRVGNAPRVACGINRDRPASHGLRPSFDRVQYITATCVYPVVTNGRPLGKL